MDALFGHRIMLIDKYSRQYLKNAFKPLGLSTAEAMVVLYLWQTNSAGTAHNSTGSKDAVNQHLGAATQERLANVLHFDKGFMTRTVKALEEKNLVERKVNPSDARSYLFNLKPEAEGLPQKITETLSTWTDKLFEGINKEQASVLDVALSKMLGNLTGASDDVQGD